MNRVPTVYEPYNTYKPFGSLSELMDGDFDDRASALPSAPRIVRNTEMNVGAAVSSAEDPPMPIHWPIRAVN